MLRWFDLSKILGLNIAHGKKNDRLQEFYPLVDRLNSDMNRSFSEGEGTG